MSIILGIHDSAFDSGAAVSVDGEIKTAIHEERTNRIKHAGGFPKTSILATLKAANISPKEVEVVAVGNVHAEVPLQLVQGFTQISPLLNPLKSRKDYWRIYAYEKYMDFYRRHLWFSKMNSKLSGKLLENMLKKVGINAKLERLDHHLNHAASAFYSSGFNRCLIITADARGDGLSTTVNIGSKEEGIRRIAATKQENSVGHFYGCITECLGFRYGDGEGKTEALAAYGKEAPIYQKLKKYIKVNDLEISADMYPYQRLFSTIVINKLKTSKKEDIAYAAQRILEETYEQLIKNAIAQTGIKNIALAGGLFLNVKLNQRILQIPEVKDIHIHPAAGDGGIPAGAALNLAARQKKLKPKRWKSAYLGNEYTNEQIKQSLRKTKYKFEYVEDIAGYVGEEILPKGNMIGWFQGRMEYGPRALGNRSILITPKDEKSAERVRTTIKKRPAFQPFCPSVLKEAQKKYVKNPKDVETPFMILTLDGTEKMKEEAPAVVFKDMSVRVQTVERQVSPLYHRVIKSFGKETGTPILLNTSFNRSGQAIVCTPEQAIYDIEAGPLDFLIIGNYLVNGKRK